MDALKTEYDAGMPPVLRIFGELDLATEEQLGDALRVASCTDPTFVLDLAGISFVDACGVRAILEAAESRSTDAPLVIRNGALLERLFRLLDLDGIASVRFGNGK